ncbi:hypothetical protein LBMAG52_03610 [Planctomycetia bacterium]|nr:hypothetical protein LBMAG52_03610 [Planctomycetia bacterium]
MRQCGALSLLLLTAVWSPPCAAESPNPRPYAESVLQDRPVAYWRLDDNLFEVHPQSQGHGVIARGVPSRLFDEDNLNDASAVSKGYVRADQVGPRLPKFLNFESDNQAAVFESPAVIKVADPGEKSLLDFGLGDSITLEAWVLVKKLGDGQQMYVVGKGRTKNAGVAEDNQNYALRLAGKKGDACVTFLFRSEDNRRGKSEDYHRWTSKTGFDIDTGWHHVATSYTFGKPESIRGYIDGKSLNGEWDFGGATTEAPVVDDDELWIGSALALNAGNSFHGSIDEVAIYRSALPAERIAARFQVLQPKPYLTTLEPPQDGVLVEVFEGIPDKLSWDFIAPEPTERFTEPAFALAEIAHKYSSLGVRADRSNPFVVRVTGDVALPNGESRFLIRSRSASRLFVDGKLVVENLFPKFRGDGHEEVWGLDRMPAPGHRALRPGDQDTIASFKSDGQKHRLTWEVFLGGKSVRPELGETCVALAAPDSDSFAVLHPTKPFALTDDAWTDWVARRRDELVTLNQQRRREASRDWVAFWNRRHEFARRLVVSPSGGTIDKLMHEGKDRQKVERRTDDWSFLRRACLDTIGTIPTAEHIKFFFGQPEATRRSAIIDKLLAEPGYADHWVSYWQDVLAENPNILNPTLNNTGPFRWWIHESFLDNKPFDQFVTELILMEGSVRYGGPGGFSIASQNDVPMAAKAHVIGQAFLGLEMKCARCHDAPYHEFLQRDLFSLAALLKREPEKVPKTSSLNLEAFAVRGREPLVKVTLKPGESVTPAWPFEKLVAAVPDELLRNPKDSRERLAAFITSPSNHRFAQVIVNRVWRRLLGWGFVEPVDDWEKAKPSHPELLEWLEREFVTHGYDVKHLTRLILNSRAYSWRTLPASAVDASSIVHGRRLTAEQLIDSLFVAAGKPFNVEEINIDVDGGRKQDVSISLGHARRAWQFTSMSNERDRPSLTLPAAQTIVDVLESFGWRASRPDPVTLRTKETTVLQPAMIANGIVAKRISQLSDDSAFTELALTAKSPEEFIDSVTQRILTRPATAVERKLFGDLLRDGFESRIVPGEHPVRRSQPPRQTGVSWSNHLKPEANLRKQSLAEELAFGDPTTSRLNADWRERAEDMIWSLINSPEFLIVP